MILLAYASTSRFASRTTSGFSSVGFSKVILSTERGGFILNSYLKPGVGIAALAAYFFKCSFCVANSSRFCRQACFHSLFLLCAASVFLALFLPIVIFFSRYSSFLVSASDSLLARGTKSEFMLILGRGSLC